MSYTVPPSAADPRRPPGIVTAASYLLYLTAVIQVVSAIIALATMGAQRRSLDLAYENFPDQRDTAVTAGVVTVIGGAIIAVLFAVGFVVLGMLLLRGKNVARIITWVVGGLAVCCLGGGLALGALSGSGFGSPSGANAPDPADIERIFNEQMPSWYGGVTTALSVIGLLAVLGTVILLALPPANEFFRRPQPTLDIPGYPTDPPVPPPGS